MTDLDAQAERWQAATAVLLIKRLADAGIPGDAIVGLASHTLKYFCECHADFGDGDHANAARQMLADLHTLLASPPIFAAPEIGDGVNDPDRPMARAVDGTIDFVVVDLPPIDQSLFPPKM